jgi:hypothetical protein
MLIMRCQLHIRCLKILCHILKGMESMGHKDYHPGRQPDWQERAGLCLMAQLTEAVLFA